MDYKGAYEFLINYTKRALYYIESLENRTITIEEAKRWSEYCKDNFGHPTSAKYTFENLEKELFKTYGNK